MKNIGLATILALAGIAYSCSSDEDFQAGPAVAETCQQVIFSNTNENTVLLSADDPNDRVATLTLQRMKSDGAITVPITVVSKSEGLTIPEQVTFEAGQSTATIQITAPVAVTEGESYSYELRLEGEHVDPYTQLAGSSLFSGSLSFPKIRRAKCWITDTTDRLGYWAEEFLDLGDGRFYIKDLMESGSDLWINLSTQYSSYYDLTLSSNRVEVEADTEYPGCYYYYFDEWDDAAQEWVWYPFYPHGKDCEVWIEQLAFYTGDSYSTYYPKQEAGSIALTQVKFSYKKSADYWKYLNFQFTDEPFDDSLPEQPNTEEVQGQRTFHVKVYYGEDFGLNCSYIDQTATMVGENQFVFENFMGSGYSFTITVDPEKDYQMTLESDGGYEYDEVFYFYDWNKEDYVHFFPAEGYDLTFYIKLDSDAYTYYDPEYQEIWLEITDITLNGEEIGWGDYIHMYWD